MDDEKTPKEISFFHKSKTWLKTHPKQSLLIGGGVLVISASATAWFLLSAPVPTPTLDTKPIKVTKKQAPIQYYSPLTGVKVENDSATKQATSAIMIENSPDARPQSGLKEAGVIYEAIAEGGITRFLAIYQEAKPEIIGPVRSLRMYYLDWATPFQASIVHFGGSAGSLNEVGNGQYRNLDLMQNSTNYYWRANDRYAPHNVYSDFGKLDELNKTKGYLTSEFSGFPRAEGKPSAEQNAKSIDIAISGPLYNPHYDYDATSNSYLRSLAGSPSLDREKGQLAPTTVVVIKVDMARVLEDGYRESIATSGSGQAYIFQNGQVTEGTWKKNDRQSQIEFIDSNQKPILLNRGQTWISAVPNSSGDVSWQ